MTVMSPSRLGDWGGVWTGVARIDSPGLHRLRIADAESNPILCEVQSGGERIVWGGHARRPMRPRLRPGRPRPLLRLRPRRCCLDFVSHQANDVYVKPHDWNYTRRVTEAHHQPGRFAVFLGCEWTTLSLSGSDHNVFYRHDQPALPRATRWYEIEGPDWPDNHTPPDLYRTLDGVDALINLHVGGFTSNLDWHDLRLERLIEVHSTHATSRWFIADAIARGYRPCIAGGSDGVSGRPGADHPGRRQSRNLRNGITGLISRGPLDRDSVWDALWAGRFYATSGPRIRMRVERVGDYIIVDVAGTAAIEAILLRRGGVRRGVSTSGVIEPVDVVETVSPTEIRLRSVTAGNRAAVVFETAEMRFTCETPAHAFSYRREGHMADLTEFIDAGVALSPAPDPKGPREAVARFTLYEPRAYWVEVLQVDGECAFWGVSER